MVLAQLSCNVCHRLLDLLQLGLLIHAGKALAALLPHDGDNNRHRRTPEIGHYGVNMRVEKFPRGSVDVILRESQKRMISHSDGSFGAAMSDHDLSAGDNAWCAVASRSEPEHVLNASVTRL